MTYHKKKKLSQNKNKTITQQNHVMSLQQIKQDTLDAYNKLFQIANEILETKLMSIKQKNKNLTSPINILNI